MTSFVDVTRFSAGSLLQADCAGDRAVGRVAADPVVAVGMQRTTPPSFSSHQYDRGAALMSRDLIMPRRENQIGRSVHRSSVIEVSPRLIGGTAPRIDARTDKFSLLKFFCRSTHIAAAIASKTHPPNRILCRHSCAMLAAIVLQRSPPHRILVYQRCDSVAQTYCWRRVSNRVFIRPESHTIGVFWLGALCG